MSDIISKIAVRLGIFLLSGYLSPLILFLANLVPLIGYLYFDWNGNDIIIIFVFETAVILFFALFKIIFLQVIGKRDVYIGNLSAGQLKHSSLSIFLTDIFLIVNNFFVAVLICLLAIALLLYSVLFLSLLILDKGFIPQDPITYIMSGTTQHFLVALIVIAVEHFFLFISNFLIGKEYNYFHPFAIPLKRTVLLLLAIIAAVELSEKFSDQHFVYLAALIFLKMLGELWMVIGERKVGAKSGNTASQW